MTRRWVPRRAWRILRPGHTAKSLRTGGVVDPAEAPTVAEGGCHHNVGSLPEWEQAMATAKPGDVVRLASSIGGRLIYRGGDPTAGAGSAAEPILITADPGVWVGQVDEQLVDVDGRQVPVYVEHPGDPAAHHHPGDIGTLRGPAGDVRISCACGVSVFLGDVTAGPVVIANHRADVEQAQGEAEVRRMDRQLDDLRRDWPGPDLSPCTAELIWEDEIRRQIEARRRGDGGGS